MLKGAPSNLFLARFSPGGITAAAVCALSREVWDEPRDVDIPTVAKWAVESNVNTINWHLSSPNDYPRLVELLDATKGVCAAGRRRMRVAVTLVTKRVAELPDNCSQPVDSPLTAWDELAYFSAPGGSLANCKDTLGWSSRLGRLAVDYPHLIGLGVDDLLHYQDELAPDEVAEMQSRMRSQAPWLSFVPTGYYGDLRANPPDMARTFDTIATGAVSSSAAGRRPDARRRPRRVVVGRDHPSVCSMTSACNHRGSRKGRNASELPHDPRAVRRERGCRPRP